MIDHMNKAVKELRNIIVMRKQCYVTTHIIGLEKNRIIVYNLIRESYNSHKLYVPT